MEDFKDLQIEIYLLLAHAELYEHAVTDERKVWAYPKEIRQRIVDGENPVKVFRDYRKMTQGALAKKAGVSKTMISHIESGRKQGSTKTLIGIAKALNMDVNDLVRDSSPERVRGRRVKNLENFGWYRWEKNYVPGLIIGVKSRYRKGRFL